MQIDLRLTLKPLLIANTPLCTPPTMLHLSIFVIQSDHDGLTVLQPATDPCHKPNMNFY